ncbi:ATP-dependent DNA helicase [Abyssisolibacter fermentans]|uniref:ATP-dependent DNA helicase n=1 Tax=Abyssisolibacter fermentans TaxID=1766203 RepID=UPI000A843A28|nr:ATP-dependent DNA helicase [Abyssisolibacter fermentans]
MDDKNKIKISVRNLVELVLRHGDLDNRFKSSVRAVEGTKAHQKVQGMQKSNYQAEVCLKHEFELEEFIFVVEGRADGIIIPEEDDDLVIIDEIKSTAIQLEKIDQNFNLLHWAQAKTYAYIYSLQNDLDSIEVQLTYFHIKTSAIKKIKQCYTKKDLKEFFYDVLNKYIVWAKMLQEWKTVRNESIKTVDFPFKNFREGQRKLAVGVYRSIKDKKNIFIEAPTGIGKTISTIFPAVKALGEGLREKLFYLTAKTITRQAAEEAFGVLRKKDLRFKTITLTAKEKICFLDECKCNPDDCKFAKGHFDRINEALLDIIRNEDDLSRTVIEQYANKHKVCPFEFALDLAIWADCVICDYNYVFDPIVYLKRFFETDESNYTFLIDEAHNLVDRAREMYSAQLNKQDFLDLKRKIKDSEPKIIKHLNKVNSFMLTMKKQCGDNNYHIQSSEPDELYYILMKLSRELEEWLSENQKADYYNELLELYFDVYSFLKISEFYDEKYITYVEKDKKDVKLKLFCQDPSLMLSMCINRGKSSVFFSATLTPLEYFRDILGGNEQDYTMYLESPYDPDNLQLYIAHQISTRYKDRDKTKDLIVSNIEKIVNNKKNYLIFFSSFKYMNNIADIFIERNPEVNVIVQSNNMSEIEREDFLKQFNENNTETLAGFCVLGGLFSEGIDLKGDRLSGAIVVGVGLPQICLERNIIRDYFNEKNSKGFEYAYMYPGMNKVLQAVGRVIRTEDDKGTVLLIGERFAYNSYKKMFPKHWNVKYLR